MRQHNRRIYSHIILYYVSVDLMAVAHAQEKLLFFNSWIKTLVCVPRIPPSESPCVGFSEL